MVRLFTRISTQTLSDELAISAQVRPIRMIRLQYKNLGCLQKKEDPKTKKFISKTKALSILLF